MLGENLKIVKENIEAAKLRAGRTDPVELLAASKTQPIERIREAYDLGIRVFGENRVQELTEKYDPALTWDMIGRLQTNKVKYVLGKARLIQSVDRLSLLEAIDREARKKNLVQEILVEINGGEERDKGGALPGEAIGLIESARRFQSVRVRGIMAVMPKTDDEGLLRRLYARVKEVRAELLALDPEASLYSAGMSGDYAIAVEYGANIVRLGRALFGERN